MATTTMKAAFVSEYVNSINEIKFGPFPKPSPRTGHALVKIKAAAGNPLDTYFMRESEMGNKLPYVFGVDFAGIVESVGENVSEVKPGDEVFGLIWGTKGMVDDVPDPIIGGCYAEYILVPKEKLTKKPPNVSFEVASSIGVIGTTAYEAILQTGKTTAGSRILILGASTGVGFVAIQLAKLVGAHVTVTASARAHDFVKQFQPDKIIDYNEKKWEEDKELRNLDLILDCVGESDSITKAISLGIVKPGGAFISIVNHKLGFNPSAYPPLSWGGFMAAVQNTKTQEELGKLVSDGKLKIPIEKIYPFTKAGVVELMEKLESKKSLGKQVLAINQ